MNRVLLLGKLAYDPEMKKTHSGLSVCNMSVSTMEPGLRKTEGQAQPHFEYHRVVAWGKTAESCGRYLKKGSDVFIEGKIRTDTYEKDGVKHKITKVHVDNIKFLATDKPAREEVQEKIQEEDDTPF